MSAYFDRSEALLGSEAMRRLASAHVLVVGVGGVGSWCAEALVRTGVGRVTLVDDDVVAESNVNRQCPATTKTVGRPKVEVMAERLREINPSADVRTLVARYPFAQSPNRPITQSPNRTIEQSPNRPITQSPNRTIEQSPNRPITQSPNRTIEQSNNRTIEQFSLVIDAIDSVDCKAQLILDAFAAGVPIISSMGAALRTDPTKVRVVRFDKVEGDGLAKALRNRFRKLGRWPGKFPCVCSVEPVSRGRCLVHGVAVSGNRTIEQSKNRTISKGSLVPVTATFGMCLASEAIKSLSAAPRERDEIAATRPVGALADGCRSKVRPLQSPSAGAPTGRIRAVLSLGSNLEPRREHLAAALAAVEAFPGTRVAAASEVEETEPVDVPDEFRELKFLNQVAIVETSLDPFEFSRRMHQVEDDLGRVRTVKNGPRTVDVDLIDFGGLEMSTPELTLPHPRANERAFVTNPWKALVRREMKARRAAVSPEERAEKSHAISAKLLGLLGDAKLVCCYEALKTELDLAEFVAACRAKGVEVVFPTAVDGDRQLSIAKRAYEVARADEVDLWICPGLAFTAKGARLGFGGGWYDRFLARAKPGARAYGVAYDFQVLPNLPQQPHDRRLDGVVV